MKDNFIFWLFTCVCFISGLVIGKVYFSKTIIKTEEVKVYGLPEGINLGELCESYYGSYGNELKRKSEIEARGYKEGLKAEIYKSY